MIKINIYCVGSMKEGMFSDAYREYIKRLSRYCSLSITEIKEEKIQNMNPEQAILNESNNIIKKIKEVDYIILLDIKGEEYSSEDFSKMIKEKIDDGVSPIDFIIGGTLGVSQELKNLANLKVSFGKITLPHQLARIVLLEQVYRSFKIIKNEPYHH